MISSVTLQGNVRLAVTIYITIDEQVIGINAVTARNDNRIPLKAGIEGDGSGTTVTDKILNGLIKATRAAAVFIGHHNGGID